MPTYLADGRDVITTVRISLAIVIFAYGLARLLAALLEWYLRSRGVRKKVAIDEGLIRFLRRIVLVVVYIIGVLILLDYLNIEISPLIAGLGIGGIAVALALQPTLANFFAGTQIISDRIIKVGDYIELDANTRGYVTDVGWRSTRIRTPYNNMLIIPNSRLADSIITNYYGPDMKMAVLVSCGVSYDSDLSRVRDVALEVTREVINDLDEAVKNFEPWFCYEEFGDSNINFWVWVQAVDRSASFMLRSELIRRLHARFNREGIEINYPMRHLVYNGDRDELPPLLGGPPEER
jgi:small-conductance mechanosensitive channel